MFKRFVLHERYINLDRCLYLMGKEREESTYVHGSPVVWVRMKHSGLYDLHGLMGAARGWFNGRKYNIIEAEHSESVKGAGKEIRFEWKAVRSVTDYIQFFMQFEVVIYRELDVVVEEQGKKKRMQQGDIEIRFKTWMVKNYRKTFRGPSKEFFRRTYEKYLIKRELLEYEGKLNNEGDAFWEIIKGILGGYQR